MLLALDSGLIDGACMPEFTGKYLLARNADLKAGMFEFSNVKESYYLGFYNNAELRDRVNEALSVMKADGTLYALQEKYLTDLAADPVPVTFETFDGAPTIRVAVTGDLPPMDYTAEDGSPAGFNTALLSELGKRLKVNIEITSIDSSARTLALTSGTVDVIFWYLYAKTMSLRTGKTAFSCRTPIIIWTTGSTSRRSKALSHKRPAQVQGNA